MVPDLVDVNIEQIGSFILLEEIVNRYLLWAGFGAFAGQVRKVDALRGASVLMILGAVTLIRGNSFQSRQ